MDMPMKKKRTIASQAAARGPLRALPEGLLDELVKGPMTPSEVQDLMLAFNKAVIERAMGAEMNLHLGYPPGQPKPEGQANERNGASGKTLITDRGPVRVELPRDRDGSFEPILIPKHERRFTGFDERIIAMYARGMSVREIQAFLAESYGTEVSPDFISSVTDEVMAETLAWQSRPLEAMYPVVFFDALRVKIRSDGVVSNKAVYLALGIQADVARKVIMSHFAQSKSEPLFRTVEAFRAKADDASEGTVDANPCAQGLRVVTARDRATLGCLPQYGGSVPEVRGSPTLQAA